MERSEILNILSDWNFWKEDIDTGIERQQLLNRINDVSKAKEITVITGIRRSGKSTLLLQFCRRLIDSGVRKEDTLMINFEDPRFKELNLDVLNRIYDIYLAEMNPAKDHYVFLDEVQAIGGWEKFARHLYENKRVNVFVTGSSSKLLSSEYSTVLAGRHMDIKISPLSFKEYLGFVGIEAKKPLDLAAGRHRINKAFYSYLEWGGFPKAVLVKEEREKRSLLEVYFRDIIIKDIVVRHEIKQVEKLEELAKYYLTNISTLQSFNRIRKLLRLNLDTVERFSRHLSDVYLLSFVRKFSYSKKEQMLNPRKVYCSDTGLRNGVAFVFSKDMGRLAENIVFTELDRRGEEIYYWKKENEVDFIIKRGHQIAEAIQICWSVGDPDVKKRELKGLIKACNEFALKEGLVITEDFEAEEKIEGKRIKYVPLWKWLLSMQA